MNKADLKLDWCSYQAAKYAVEHWHYSKVLPVGKLVRIGVWENDNFIGAVVFSPGACPSLGSAYGAGKFEVCELIRISLTKHVSPVSRILSISINMLRKLSPGLRLLVSFADPYQEHVGGVYQATNWIYTGTSGETTEYFVNGRWWHTRVFRSSEWSSVNGADLTGKPKRNKPGKHRYLYPLDPAMRAQIAPLAKPYPKRGPGEIDNAPGTNPETGGASPTGPL